MRRKHSHAVWADQSDPGFAGGSHQLGLRLCPLLGGLREAGSNHESGGDSAFAALPHHVDHVGGAERDQRQIGGLRQVRDAGVGGQEVHGPAAPIHGVDPAVEASVDDIAQERAAPLRRITRGADDRDRTR